MAVGVTMSACTSDVQGNFDNNEDEMVILQSTEPTFIFTDTELKNAENQSEWIDSGLDNFPDGKYREQAAHGSTS